eukprot:GHVT01015877.1.p1 GENE.GHVT01015877.1~~GHVT01015877.1.p1  ORF type:complete len:661 (+),score=132.26 GHVT01015877.1:1760-3742(+)
MAAPAPPPHTPRAVGSSSGGLACKATQSSSQRAQENEEEQSKRSGRRCKRKQWAADCWPARGGANTFRDKGGDEGTEQIAPTAASEHAGEMLTRERKIGIACLCALLFFILVICYLDRSNFSVTMIKIAQQAKWSATEQGLVASGFFVGYACTQVLGGLLSDHYGGKIVLFCSALVWGAATAIFPHIAMLGVGPAFAVRVILGLGEGAAVPSCASLISSNVPASSHTLAVSLVWSGMYFGACLAFGLTPIIVTSIGWQMSYWIFAAVTILWLVPWLFFDITNLKFSIFPSLFSSPPTPVSFGFDNDTKPEVSTAGSVGYPEEPTHRPPPPAAACVIEVEQPSNELAEGGAVEESCQGALCQLKDDEGMPSSFQLSSAARKEGGTSDEESSASAQPAVAHPTNESAVLHSAPSWAGSASEERGEKKEADDEEDQVCANEFNSNNRFRRVKLHLHHSCSVPSSFVPPSPSPSFSPRPRGFWGALRALKSALQWNLALILSLLRHKEVWALITGQYFQGYGMFALHAWLPTYIQQRYDVSMTELPIYTTLPYFVQGVTAILSGFLGEWMLRRWKWRRRSVRRILQTIGMLLPAVFLWLTAEVANDVATACGFLVVALSLSTLTIAAISVAQMDFVPQYAGNRIDDDTPRTAAEEAPAATAPPT